ncbi:MAG: histidinol dehydrogenase [Gemmatimonadales bacterium]
MTLGASLFAVRGSLAGLDDRRRRLLCDRTAASDPGLRERVAALVAEVRRDGDAALRRLARELDGVELEALDVPPSAWTAALSSLDAALREALERAAAAIRSVHQALRPGSVRVVSPDGAVITRRPDPLARVGVYAPGGRAAYPSSLLMGALPARAAGVGEIIVCAPPGRDGKPAAVVLAAAAIAGVDRLFAVGGAGAVSAMAYGTSSIPRVDRIVGPGNAWVNEAKLQVSRDVGIDAPAGPSELLIIADDSASPARVAGELAAQAEHDPEAAVVLVTTSPALAEEVETELEQLLRTAPRAEIIRASLATRGGVLLAASIADAVAFAADYAPEHLLLACREPGEVAARTRNAGAVFLGESSSVVFGDYSTGANHVLPTAGAARTWSGLSTLDFVRWTTLQEVPAETAAALAADTARLARAEGLPAHAEAVATKESVA